MATVSAGLLACAVAVGCGKDNNRRDTAASTSTPATTPADTTLRGTQAGMVAGITTEPSPTPRADPNEVARVETASDANARVKPEREDAARPAEGAPLSDNTGAAAVGASNSTTITAEPQVVTVVLLANIGDKERAARMCLSPTALNNQALRDYVQQEMRDHQQLNDRVNQLVRSKNIIPTRSQVGDQFFQRNQDQPRADENARDFFAREARLHQDMLTALDQHLLPSARDTALRQLLTDGKTMVQAHLTRVQQLQGTATNQPAASMNQPAAPNPSSQRDTLNREPKPANLSPAYGETTSVRVTPPAASAAITPNSASASVTTPAASVTTTPGAAAAAPATNPCDVAPANHNQAPGLRFDMQHDMQRDSVRPDTARLQMRPDTTPARPTPPRP